MSGQGAEDKMDRLATIAVAGVIAAAYHVTGRSPEEARAAIMDWLTTPITNDTRVLLVGDLYDLTDWTPPAGAEGGCHESDV